MTTSKYISKNTLAKRRKNMCSILNIAKLNTKNHPICHKTKLQ